MLNNGLNFSLLNSFKGHFNEEDGGTVCAGQSDSGSLSDMAPNKVISLKGNDELDPAMETKKENLFSKISQFI